MGGHLRTAGRGFYKLREECLVREREHEQSTWRRLAAHGREGLTFKGERFAHGREGPRIC